MKYWVNKNSEIENFVVLVDQSLVIGSCDKGNIASCEKKLLAGDSPSDVFGIDDFAVIRLSQIFKLVGRSTDVDVEVDYKVKNEESKLVGFENIDVTKEFLATIGSQLPERLKKKEYQQSLLAAGLPSLLSFAVALGASAMFFNKFRWLTLIVGGIWALASLYKFFTRVANPPLVTQWSSKNAAGAAWSQFKVAGSLALSALIVFSVSTRFPDNYGEMTFVQHMDHGELTADNVATLLENGGDINRISDYGSRPLHYAVYSEDLGLFKSLLNNGADPSLKDDHDSDALDDSVYYNQREMTRLLLTEYQSRLDLSGRLNEYVSSSVSPEMLTVLFSNGVDPAEIDKDGNNALQAALLNYADYEMVLKLIEYKVPSNVKLEGRSLKQYALDNGQDDIARLFDERSLSFERERELTEEIDAFYADKVKDQLSKASGFVKLIASTQDISDEERLELVQDLSKSMQYKSLSAAGNQRVLATYATACENSGFEHSDDFKRRMSSRARKLAGHSRVSELIIERNRSVYNEAKDEFVTPTDFNTRVNRSISKIEKLYLDADKDGADVGALNKKCASVYGKVAGRKK